MVNQWWQFISLILIPTSVLTWLTFLPRHQHLGTSAAYHTKRAVAILCGVLICVTGFVQSLQSTRNLGWLQVQAAAQEQAKSQLADTINTFDFVSKSIDIMCESESNWINRVRWNTTLLTNGSPLLQQYDDQMVQQLDGNLDLLNSLQKAASSRPEIDIKQLQKAISDIQNAKSYIQINKATDSGRLAEHEAMFENALTSTKFGMTYYFYTLHHLFSNYQGEFYSEMVKALQDIHGFEKNCIPAPLMVSK